MCFNPIPAGVLENQDMIYDLCPNMTNDTSLESSCALLLESAKKFANLRKLNLIYRKIQFYSKNVCNKKFVQKMKNYTYNWQHCATTPPLENYLNLSLHS